MAFKVEFPTIPGNPKEIPPIERAMLAMSYGVHVIGSVSKGGEMNAMLADWIMQISFKPRLVACAIENDARTLRFIRETGVFSVNMLHEKDGIDIARKVVMPSEAGKVRGRTEGLAAQTIDKLEGISYVIGENGCPLLNDALGWYTCDAQRFVTTGDHTIVIGQVVDGDIIRTGEMLIERDLGWEYAG